MPFKRRSISCVKLAAIAVLAFLHFPVLIIVLYSLTTEQASFQFPPPGLTLDWYEAARDRPDLWDALERSLEVAGIATVTAILLGSMAALAVYRRDFFGREMVSLLIILPISLPGIVTAISLRSAFSQRGIDLGLQTIVIGHATFTIVVVFNNVVARLRRTAQSQIEASMDLGAIPLQTFKNIILPQVSSALLAGALLAFALSFDEIVVTNFTAAPGDDTLPIWILRQLSRPRDRPVTNVAAVIVITATFIPILLAYHLSREPQES
ncbi:MAG: ABC transporter permease [Chloroflexi bacterium]|nr:ABC transporter permease [Chloroflexota bacterium]